MKTVNDIFSKFQLLFYAFYIRDVDHFVIKTGSFLFPGFSKKSVLYQNDHMQGTLRKRNFRTKLCTMNLRDHGMRLGGDKSIDIQWLPTPCLGVSTYSLSVRNKHIWACCRPWSIGLSIYYIHSCVAKNSWSRISGPSVILMVEGNALSSGSLPQVI